jgi:amino acid transporter
MKEKFLEQISKELKLATRVDMAIMIVGALVTLVFFTVAAGSAASTVNQMPNLSSLAGGLFGGLTGGQPDPTFSVTSTIIMFVTLALIFVINWCGVRALLKNKAQRAKMNEGLAKLYKDEMLDQYNDGSIYKAYETRYNLFAVIMGSVAALSIIVPLVIFVDNLTNL